MPLRIYLCIAYAVADCPGQISGPGWIDSEYDIAAKVPPGATKEQLQKMLQNLLTERFKLVLHHESRTLPVYELVVAKSGPKFTGSAKAPNPGAPPDGPLQKIERDRDGFPTLPPGRAGLISSFGPGWISHWTAQQQTMAALARSVSLPNAAGRQVIDKTGLSGTYDFKLYYETRPPGAPPSDDSQGPILVDALEQQLGLKLVDGKAAFDFVIIERGERVPAEN